MIYWQFAPEEITAVIETRQAGFVLICFCHSVFLGISSPSLIYTLCYLKIIYIFLNAVVNVGPMCPLLTQGILTEMFCCQNPHPAMNLLSESPHKRSIFLPFLMSLWCQKELLLSKSSLYGQTDPYQNPKSDLGDGEFTLKVT